ncbi:N-acetylglucosamine repressor [Pararobbsia alpina]|uniref:N-acetylglucosamine repressor n=1 Tax=Pararobbsia alpina TaxID=621374 RepID=A0A6S7CYZ8_9BURK|nr:N-acetylglucosamine repressor [Pararobbsia alpina]
MFTTDADTKPAQAQRTAPNPNGPGAILALIRSGRATTRTQIMQTTGLSRSTVALRLDTLLAAGYISSAALENSTGGRPPGSFQIDPAAGVMLLAAIGAGSMQLAVTDMHGTVLARDQGAIDVADGPERVLGTVAARFDALLAQAAAQGRNGRSSRAQRTQRALRANVKGIGIGVPGPVEFAQGRVVRPPIMTGWDGYRVADFFEKDYACPVLVDKDVNLMALGEHRAGWPDAAHMLFVKVSTGIGAGMIMDQVLQRGAHGGAGDLGHLYVGHLVAGEPSLCRCGNYGCLEAYAAGWAICQRLRAAGHRADTVRDAADLAQQGVREAVEQMQEAGRLLGETIAMAVSLLNPSLVVLGGELGTRQSDMLAVVRETVYRRSLPLATRHLQIVNSRLGADAGLLGATHLVSDALFAPQVVDEAIEQWV